jgi:Biotin-lipoyl like
MGAPITASCSFPSHRTQPLSRPRNPKHIGCLCVDTPAEGRTVTTCFERSSRRSSRGNTDMHLNDESPTACDCRVVRCLLWWLHARQLEDADDAIVEGHISGISSRISGIVVAVYVDQNDFVKAGEDLVDLDPRDYQVSLDSPKPGASCSWKGRTSRPRL